MYNTSNGNTNVTDIWKSLEGTRNEKLSKAQQNVLNDFSDFHGEDEGGMVGKRDSTVKALIEKGALEVICVTRWTGSYGKYISKPYVDNVFLVKVTGKFINS